jgi:hypothetical protein
MLSVLLYLADFKTSQTFDEGQEFFAGHNRRNLWIWNCLKLVIQHFNQLRFVDLPFAAA